MKLLSIDYGAKRIGLAVGEIENHIVVPYGLIENKGRDFVFREINSICAEERIDKIIIGMPSHGEIRSKQAELTKDFAQFLKSRIEDVEVLVFDESFTSKIADQDMRYKDLMKDKKKGWRDMLAAAEILRGYMDKNL
ncbi:hypothetical protein A2Y83_04740 [Candidatus Falkowbacteria bacterium RBG_13_39_14]|uniref:Putative pre-16S rRNA nuclease n=1 Tax=Candidatus Falkowbacteria bacterium RBG_13_39_14 TaxID=1797985 RepID=A0A1F5S176_9BACT|nr:MAG: hypothetical protein A2Y83_04740 [Candidatus Falkowbacteria bacterium RBG_13_39_14]